jgi:hypothetical protein
MSDQTKEYNNLDEMFAAAQTMRQFQKIHNIIRPDFILLLKITEEQKNDKDRFNTLYRACLIRFFTLIEADIYGLNQFDMYSDYDDKKDRFIEKFKETYKQICMTWNKQELQKKYFDTKLQSLKELKSKRDNLVHPKQIEHIHKASEEDFNKVNTAFDDYDKFINDLMNDFFIGTKINLL